MLPARGQIAQEPVFLPGRRGRGQVLRRQTSRRSSTRTGHPAHVQDLEKVEEALHESLGGLQRALPTAQSLR